MALTHDENTIIDELTHSGFSKSEATLAIIMSTRQHARKEDQLIDTVRVYPTLEDEETAKNAICKLKEMGWLEESVSYERKLLHQAPDLNEKIATRLGHPEYKSKLETMRSSLERHVNVLGPMHKNSVYASYFDHLGRAENEICLPMLATTPKSEAVLILQERSKIGVKIKILLSSPKVVVALRGENNRQLSLNAISGWKKHVKGHSNMEMRISHSVDHSIIATCVSIDKRILRFDVYDPFQQRSLEGIMLESVSPKGFKLNLIDIYQKQFDAAWNSSQPITWKGNFRWWLYRGWQLYGMVIFVILTAITHQETSLDVSSLSNLIKLPSLVNWNIPLDISWLSNIFGGVAGTLLFYTIISSRNRIKKWFKH